jgi:hypothetical protein
MNVTNFSGAKYAAMLLSRLLRKADVTYFVMATHQLVAVVCAVFGCVSDVV